MRPSSTLCALWVALVAAAIARPALAQNDDERRAATLFTEGRAALERGDYTSACPKFEASSKLVML